MPDSSSSSSHGSRTWGAPRSPSASTCTPRTSPAAGAGSRRRGRSYSWPSTMTAGRHRSTRTGPSTRIERSHDSPRTYCTRRVGAMRTRRTASTDRDTERRSGLSDPWPTACEGLRRRRNPPRPVRRSSRRGPGAWVAPQLRSGGRGPMPLVIADDADDGASLHRPVIAELVRLEVGEADRVASGESVFREADAERQLAIEHDVGSFAGYFGGWIDNVLMRVVDIVLSLPSLFIILALVSFWGGGGIWVIIIAI